MKRRAWLLAVVLAAGCSGGDDGTGLTDGGGGGGGTADGGTDGGPDSGSDGGPGDGGSGDAGMCPSGFLLTGEYIDWDSTPESFAGVFDAQVAEVGNPANSMRTPPNGRVILCLPADARSVVTFTQPDYLPVRYTVAPEAAMQGPFSIRGLSTVPMEGRRTAEEVYTTELGLTRDEAAAQVVVAVRMYPDDLPATGAQVALGNAAAASYTAASDGTYGPGDTLVSDAFVLFGNVEIGAGTTTVTVTPPAGAACTGPDTIDVVAGEIAVTTFACTPQ